MGGVLIQPGGGGEGGGPRDCEQSSEGGSATVAGVATGVGVEGSRREVFEGTTRVEFQQASVDVVLGLNRCAALGPVLGLIIRLEWSRDVR